jgi:hypothetical protein
MRSFILAIVGSALVCALLFGAGLSAKGDNAVSASATKATDRPSAKRRKRPHRPPAVRSQGRAPAQIACPRGGCRPVPAGCGAVAERDLEGNPTGYEIIVCPPR